MIKSVHLEVTNICMLKCPRCARTNLIEKFGINKWNNLNLNLNDLKQFLDIDLTDITLVLCGNNGDPIYYPYLFELIKWAKEKNACIQITTNGSYKAQEWWKELAALLNENDVIIFSVDGSPENFTNYRINANWPSIELGMKIIAASKAKAKWKYIPFQYNLETIKQTQDLAQSMGLEFFIDPSDRWEEEDIYKPTDNKLQGPRTVSIIQWRNKKEKLIAIDPKCYNNNQHYISADGFYMPCCYVGDWRFYYKSDFYKNKQNYDISKTSISKLLTDPALLDYYKSIPINKPNYCTFNCPKI